MDESTESQAIGPGLREVLREGRVRWGARDRTLSYPDVNLIVLPRPALTPDQDGLHLGGQALLPGDPQLQGQPGVGGHTSTLAVPDQDLTLLDLQPPCSLYSRVESGSGVFNLLNQSGHVLQEEIVEMLLLHVLQFEGLLLATTDHDDGEMSLS